MYRALQNMPLKFIIASSKAIICGEKLYWGSKLDNLKEIGSIKLELLEKWTSSYSPRIWYREEQLVGQLSGATGYPIFM